MHPVGKTIGWIEKWITHFMMGTTSSITMQVRKCGVCFYRQDAAKRQTAGIVFTHRPKIRFFVAPIQVKLCSTDGHLGPLDCAKYQVNRCRRVGMRPPKYQIFPLFGRVAPQVRLPCPISKIFTGFYTSNYPTSEF